MNEQLLLIRRRAASRKIQPKRFSSPIRWAFVAFLLAALVLGCSSRPKQPAAPALLRYTPEEAALFNDLFRPELFGLEPLDDAPERDSLLGDRIARADLVVPGRIVTITREADAQKASYSVVVRPEAAALVGQTDATAITLSIGVRSPVYGWVEASANRPMRGKLLLFLRNYEEGAHFYATVDTPGVREAIARVRIERIDARDGGV